MKSIEETAREIVEAVVPASVIEKRNILVSKIRSVSKILRQRDAERDAEIESVAAHLASNEQYHKEHVAKGFMVDHHKAVASMCGFYLTMIRTKLLGGK